MNRSIMSVASVLALCVSLAACGGRAGQDGTPKEFTYWSMWKQGELQQKVLKATFDEFTAKTGIKVNIQWAGRQVLQQVTPRLNAGNPPDLVDSGSDALEATLGPINGLQGLADVYNSPVDGEKDKVAAVIPASLVEPYKTEDRQPWIVPYITGGSTIWFNGKIDPQLTADPPKTWDDLIAALDRLKAAGRTPVVLDGDIKGYEGLWLVWALLRAGGVGTLKKAALDKTGAAFDDTAWPAAVGAIEKLVKGGYFPAGFSGTKFPAQQSAWADQSSKTDIWLMGTWAPSETTASLTKAGKDPKELIEYRSFPFPSITANDKGAGVMETSMIGFGIPAKARHTEAAKRFLTFFMNRERLARMTTEAETMVPRTDIKAPEPLTDFAAEYKSATAYAEITDGVSAAAARWNSDIWEPMVGEFFEGRYDTASFIKTLKQKTIAFHQNGG
ncbi:ABC transporter substrate-binding protein [Nonomuraea sediminis]|uniref:ABC transporter substrate-binding protein n=1 Tax=Nonomuraea sediminis TaxID=2835864 RepID=UPI001BDD049B|nr:ABC transporter substrate-binding protein [Nonomuraea sediminis]